MILALLAFGTVHAQNVLDVVDTQAQPGETNVAVAVHLINPTDPVAGIQFTFHFDTTLMSFIDVQRGQRLSESFDVSYNCLGDSVIVVIVSLSGDSLVPGSGEVAVFHFDISSTASVGDSAVLWLSNPVLSSPQGTHLSVTVDDGVIRIVSQPRVIVQAIPYTVQAGGDAFVPIELQNPEDFVSGIQFTLRFDGSLLIFNSFDDSLPSSFTCASNDFSDSIKVVCVSLSGDSLAPPSNLIGTVNFTVSSSLLPDDSLPIFVDDVVISDPQAQHIPSTGLDGYIGIAPPVPEILWPATGTFLGTRTFNVVWTSVSGAASYVVELSNHSDFSSLLDSLELVDTTHSFTVDSDGFYFVRVRSMSSRGYGSDWSPIDSFGVDVTPPSGVELIAPENNSILNTSEVAFDWSDAVDTTSGIAGYWLAVSMDASFGSADSFFVSLSETTLTLADTTWFWRVKAVDNSGLESDWTEAWTLTIDTHVPETPMLISPVGGEWLHSTSVTFEWTRVGKLAETYAKATPVHYVVEVLSGGSAVLTDTVDTNTMTVELGEGFYDWHVMAFDEAGNTSDWSSIDSFGVDVTPPRTPDLVSPADGFITSSNSMEFIWTASSDNLSGIMGYSLTLGDSVWNTSDTSMTVDLSYFSEGTYAWHIEVFDNAENFAITDDRTLVIDRTPPLIDSFTLWPDTSWFFGPFEVDAWISDNLSGVGSAWLFWSVDGSPFDSTAMSPSNGVWSGEIPAIDDSANHTVSYFVKALDNAEPANVSTSDTVDFTVISIEESQNQGLPSKFELLGVVQNPVKGGLIGLRLAVPSPCDAKFAIYDVTGRCVWRTTSHFEAGYHDVNLRADLRSGVYFIEVSAPFGKADVKVVISR